jgi:hypothetical protein
LVVIRSINRRLLIDQLIWGSADDDIPITTSTGRASNQLAARKQRDRPPRHFETGRNKAKTRRDINSFEQERPIASRPIPFESSFHVPPPANVDKERNSQTESPEGPTGTPATAILNGFPSTNSPRCIMNSGVRMGIRCRSRPFQK